MLNRLEYIIAETVRIVKTGYKVFSLLCTSLLVKCLIAGELEGIDLFLTVKNCARTSGVLCVMRIKIVAVVHHEIDFNFCGSEVKSIAY